MRDTLFIWVEAYEYPSGLQDRGIPLECFYHFGEVHEGAVFIYYFLKG